MYVRIELKSLYAEEPIGACSSFVCIQQYLAPINHVFERNERNREVCTWIRYHMVTA